MGETFAGKGFREFKYLQTSRSNLANGVTHLQNGTNFYGRVILKIGKQKILLLGLGTTLFLINSNLTGIPPN